MYALNGFWKRFHGLAMPILMFALCVPAFGAVQNKQTQSQQSRAPQTELERAVRHEIILLPYYTLFDYVQFKVEDDNTVVLSGKVIWPQLKKDAGTVVGRIKGVKKVINNIEVLPLSPFDNTIRRREFYAIYSSVGFERYAIQAVPPIHIIVDNGHVTLEGVVADQFDKNQAGIAANQVPQIFSVTNNLRVEHND